MHHYCLILSKSSNDFSSKVCSYIHKDLIFKPEKMYFANFGEAAVVSFQVNLGAFGVDSYCYFEEKKIVLVHGLPTFERHDASIINIAKIDPAQAMMKIIGDMGFEAACQTLGGVFSIVYSDGLNAFFNSSFCGYGSAFYYADDNIFVLSNRQNLVLSIVGSDKCRYNLDSASWILSTTMLIEHDALYTGIKKTMPGFTLIRHHDGTLENKVPVSRFDLPPSKGGVACDELYDGLLARYKYYLSLPIKWHAHITGGKDSRAALSAILASGKKSAIEKFITNGAKNNGDVQVAKLISLDENIKNHIIKEGGKKSDLTENEILAIDGRFDYSSWRYEGYLTSWDGTGSTAGRRPGFVTLMGGGGEIYRQKGIVFSNSDIDSSVNKLMLPSQRPLGVYAAKRAAASTTADLDARESSRI